LTKKTNLREAASVERTDAELVGLTRGGDREAFGALVARYQGHVYGLAYSMVDNWAEAQDIAQETFIRAYTNLDQLRDPERFPAWLRRITFSVTMNWLKAFRPGLIERLGDLDIDALDIPDFQPGPPEVVEKRELADAVLRAVASLPPKYRVPLTMFHLDGLSYQKVADFLDVPLGTAKSLIHRAREKLKLALASYAAEGLAPMVQEVFNEHRLPGEFAQKVLDNVPNLGWGRQRECTFLGALEAALAPTEHPFAYTDMMGWSGMAFRTRWFAGNESGARWCPSCAVGEMEEEIDAVAKATGWPLRAAFVQKEDEAAMAGLTSDFVASINADRPVLAYEPRGNMDVVFGYEEGGKTLLLRDYFQPDTPLKLAPSELGFLIIFVDEHTRAMPRRDALVMALETAVRNWRRVKFSEGPGAYWYGAAALDRWIADLNEAEQFTPEEKGQLCSVGWWNYSTLHDARMAAVAFLHDNAALLLDLARAADLYRKETNLLASAFANRDAFTNSADNWTAEMRQRERDILTRARAIEEEAISFLEKALAVL
jgi:RNA polymerase sigma-70 factor (ECF subfamily)